MPGLNPTTPGMAFSVTLSIAHEAPTTRPEAASSSISDSAEATKANSVDAERGQKDIVPAGHFRNGWHQAGFVTAVMLGQAFNLTPFGAVRPISLSFKQYNLLNCIFTSP